MRPKPVDEADTQPSLPEIPQLSEADLFLVWEVSYYLFLRQAYGAAGPGEDAAAALPYQECEESEDPTDDEA